MGVCFDAQARKVIQHELCQNKAGSDKGVLSVFLGVLTRFSHIMLFFLVLWVALSLACILEQKHPLWRGDGQHGPKATVRADVSSPSKAQFLIIFWVLWG